MTSRRDHVLRVACLALEAQFGFVLDVVPDHEEQNAGNRDPDPEREGGRQRLAAWYARLVVVHSGSHFPCLRFLGTSGAFPSGVPMLGAVSWWVSRHSRYIGRSLKSATKNPGLPLGERSEEHTSELQSHLNIVCRLLLE